MSYERFVLFIPERLNFRQPLNEQMSHAKKFPRLVFLIVFYLVIPCIVHPAQASDRPNIVVIVADDLGYGALSCYGQQKYQTPNIDRLAAEGLRFTHFYSGSHVCAPSRSALMTGLHTGHTPIRANGPGMFLSPEDRTLAEALHDAGYVTGMFGKWGLGDAGTPGHPNLQGFDEFFGQTMQVHAHFYYPYFLWHNSEQFPLPENEGRKRIRYAHDEIHGRALAFIRDHKDEQFFCYLPYTLPHVELVVPEDSLGQFAGKFDEQPLPDPRTGYIGAEQPYATFAAMVTRLDRHVGEVAALLDELNLTDNTLVIFTSDNGAQAADWQRVADFFSANGQLRGYKSSFYEGGIRVPLIARWPGAIPNGAQSDLVCANWDLMPTLCELAQANDSLDHVDGISLVPELRGRFRDQRRHEFLYWEHPGNPTPAQAVRLDNWKAIRRSSDPTWQLYDLAADESEQFDVAAEHQDIVQRIEQIASGQHSEPRVFTFSGQAPGVNDFVR